MAEALSAFVGRRRADWDALSALVERQRAGALGLEDLERLDRLYRVCSRDLAHVQTNHPGSDVARFLNQLCASAYGAIYRPPNDRFAALRRFYAADLPRTFRRTVAHTSVSAALFVLGGMVGALVVLFEPRGAEVLVPQGIRDAVADGRMWTEDVFSVMPGGMASTWIATNNLTVTFTVFALGIVFGLGSAAVLLNNGLHIGSVIALCVHAGMGSALLDFIGAHGPVELSIIVIAGGAGLMLGHALVDPGELPRAQALRQRGGEAVKLVVGLAPFLGAIALVEGFVSPSALPTWLKVSVGLALGAALWLYLLVAGRSEARAPLSTGASRRS